MPFTSLKINRVFNTNLTFLHNIDTPNTKPRSKYLNFSASWGDQGSDGSGTYDGGMTYYGSASYGYDNSGLNDMGWSGSEPSYISDSWYGSNSFGDDMMYSSGSYDMGGSGSEASYGSDQGNGSGSY